MSNSARQNILFFILILLTLNIVVISGAGLFGIVKSSVFGPAYDIIDCTDTTGRIRKCIRIDKAAGEFNNPNGAAYRAIFGN